MVSQGANSTSSVIDDLILGSTSATSTNATSLPTVTSGVEEMETLSDAHGPSTSLSESLVSPGIPFDLPDIATYLTLELS